MAIVVVPNDLRDAIYAKIDEALKEHPGASADRELYFERLLAFYDDRGFIPEFKIMPNDSAESEE